MSAALGALIGLALIEVVPAVSWKRAYDFAQRATCGVGNPEDRSYLD
jgi:hypothetical protein